ncbi:MAG: hypothetical protein AABX38_01510 [Candidatus Micrarchaeota archaeon]
MTRLTAIKEIGRKTYEDGNVKKAGYGRSTLRETIQDLGSRKQAVLDEAREGRKKRGHQGR